MEIQVVLLGHGPETATRMDEKHIQAGVLCLSFFFLAFCCIVLISIGDSTERVANLIKVLRAGMFGM